MMQYMLITNDPEQARTAAQAGVQRIEVDLEIHGKHDRQGHKDTFITTHQPEDIAVIRAAVPEAELMVRVNPYHLADGAKGYRGTQAEIDHAIEHGADLIMLPMFTTAEEVKKTSDIIAGRAKLAPLFEHVKALEVMEEVCENGALDEAHLGLNDLHISLGQSFLFETLLGEWVEQFCATAKRYGLSYGFGGVGSVLHEGGDIPIPPSLIIKEHARLGSSRVILSRAFKSVATADAFKDEVRALDQCYADALRRDERQMTADHNQLRAAIEGVVAKMAAAS